MEYFVEVYLYIAERTKDGLDNPERFNSRSSRSTAKNSPITHRASKLDAQRAFNTPSYIHMNTSNPRSRAPLRLDLSRSSEVAPAEP